MDTYSSLINTFNKILMNMFFEKALRSSYFINSKVSKILNKQNYKVINMCFEVIIDKPIEWDYFCKIKT